MNGFVPRFPDLMDVSVTTNKNFNKIQEISHVISLDDDFEAIELNRGFKKQKVNTIKIANAYYSLEEVTDVVNSFVPVFLFKLFYGIFPEKFKVKYSLDLFKII